MRLPRRSKLELFPAAITPAHVLKVASSGERVSPAGAAPVVPGLRRTFFLVGRFLLPGDSSHILIRCSTRRSTIRRATDFGRSVCGMLPK